MAVRRPGCSFCRNEATKISKIAPQLKEKNVSIVGVVHEMLGVEDFRPFLKDADIYYDPEVNIYNNYSDKQII
jgi:hypothetical protein